MPRAPQKTTPPATLLNTLYGMGTQCYFEGGPAVYYAQELYQRFTGIELEAPDCSGAGKPGYTIEDRSEISGQTAIINPNPAGDYLEVSMDMAPIAEPVVFTLYNAIGVSQLESLLTSKVTHIETAHLLPGIYFARAVQGNKTIFVKPVVIQH